MTTHTRPHNPTRPSTIPSARRWATAGMALALVGLLGCSRQPGVSTTRTPSSGQPMVAAPVTAPSAASAASVPSAASAVDLSVTVDPGLTPVGRPDLAVLSLPDGETETVMADRLAVVASDQETFDALMSRWPLTVVESSTADDGAVEALVELAPDAVVDTSTVAADLDALQPSLSGALSASSERVVQLYTIVAAEGRRGEVIVVPDDALTFHAEDAFEAISHGHSTESTEPFEADATGQASADPFTWNYLADGSVQDFGVVGAWTILEGTGSFRRSVPVIVQDGGFAATFDYGPNSEIIGADWGDPNEMGCGPDNPCPWHGTGVAQTMLGHIDDWTGVAGTGGPIARLFALETASPSSWRAMRDLRDLALFQNVKVVNMSWSGETTTVPGIREAYYDRTYRKLHDAGTLLVAAAGNKGRNIDAGTCGNGCDETRLHMPCESRFVLCVGGVAPNSTDRAPGSNFGTVDDDRSVEIYGPMRVVVSSIDESGAAPALGPSITAGGTSFSSPFVAGIATLLYSADLDMSPSTAADLLMRTARPVVSDIEIRAGSRRLVNARHAVLELLGIELQSPTISFAAPTPADGATVSPDGLVAIRPVATDMFGNPLWITSVMDDDQDTTRTVGSNESFSVTALPGTHTVTARAADRFGQHAQRSTTFTVPEVAAMLEIIGVAEGDTIDGGTTLELIGRGRDGVDFQPIPTSGLVWGLLDADGKLVALDEGETARFELPNVDAGFTVVLTSNDVNAAEHAVGFSVRAIDPDFRPTISILSPADEAWFAVNGSFEAEIEFQGRAYDHDTGAAIAAERLRWVATASNGERRTLCEGTSFTTTPGSIVSELVGCRRFSATLSTVATGGQNTWWRISLEVLDPVSGSIASTSTLIYLEYIAS